MYSARLLQRPRLLSEAEQVSGREGGAVDHRSDGLCSQVPQRDKAASHSLRSQTWSVQVTFTLHLQSVETVVVVHRGTCNSN